MTFSDEVTAGFAEAEKPMEQAYLLTNEPHTGIIRQSHGEGSLREPGFESVEEIVIVSTTDQFTRKPEETAREIVQIDSGPFAGKWVLTGVVSDVAHYTLTCQASE